MTFDSVILAAVADELNKKLTNGKINSIYQPSPLDAILNVYSNGANYSLFISADAQFPRAHLTSRKPDNPKVPPTFCMTLRKHLSGARLTGVEQVDMDRILHLHFTAYDGNRTTLVVEIMGKHSNVILISDGGRILGTIKPIGATKSRYRQVLPGRDYVAPPAQNKLDPLTVTRDEFNRLLGETFSEQEHDMASWLVSKFAGISPFAAQELAARAGGDTSALAEQFEQFFADVKAAEFEPVVIMDSQGHTVGYYAFRTHLYPDADQHDRQSISTAADIYYTSALPRFSFDKAFQEFSALIRKEHESQERAVASMREALERCANAEKLKQIGELILAQQHAIPAGASEVTLPDYYDPEMREITIELNPKLSVIDNAEAYFKKYQKSGGEEASIRERLSDAEGKLRLVDRVLRGLGSVNTVDQIKELTKLLEDQGIRLHAQQAEAKERGKPDFDGHRIRSMMTEGWEILVGQNSEANDYLLTRVASPNDWWVHVKASPSAHVVIRTKGRPDAVPRSVLYSAAELAAQNSDAKHSSLVPVDYTLRKFVRKPKGAPSGKAIYQREKTLFVTPTP